MKKKITINWISIVLGVSILIMAFYCMSLKNDLRDLRSEIYSCQNEKNEIEDELEEANDKIDELERELENCQSDLSYSESESWNREYQLQKTKKDLQDLQWIR